MLNLRVSAQAQLIVSQSNHLSVEVGSILAFVNDVNILGLPVGEALDAVNSVLYPPRHCKLGFLPPTQRCGYMLIRCTHKVHKNDAIWAKRYFLLTDTALQCQRAHDDVVLSNKVFELPLPELSVYQISCLCMKIIATKRSVTLKAASAESLLHWLIAIQYAIALSKRQLSEKIIIDRTQFVIQETVAMPNVVIDRPDFPKQEAVYHIAKDCEIDSSTLLHKTALATTEHYIEIAQKLSTTIAGDDSMEMEQSMAPSLGVTSNSEKQPLIPYGAIVDSEPRASHDNQKGPSRSGMGQITTISKTLAKSLLMVHHNNSPQYQKQEEGKLSECPQPSSPAVPRPPPMGISSRWHRSQQPQPQPQPKQTEFAVNVPVSNIACNFQNLRAAITKEPSAISLSPASGSSYCVSSDRKHNANNVIGIHSGHHVLTDVDIDALERDLRAIFTSMATKSVTAVIAGGMESFQKFINAMEFSQLWRLLSQEKGNLFAEMEMFHRFDKNGKGYINEDDFTGGWIELIMSAEGGPIIDRFVRWAMKGDSFCPGSCAASDVECVMSSPVSYK